MSTLSADMSHRETKCVPLGYTEIPWPRNNDRRSSGVMLWSGSALFPPITLYRLWRVWSLLSLLHLCSAGAETQQHRASDTSALVFSLPCYGSTMEGHPIVVFWELSMQPGAGRTVREAVRWGKAKGRLAVLCFCSGLGMLSCPRCIPSGPVSALWSSPNWRVWLWLKVTLISALGLRVLRCGSWRTSP